MSGSSGEFRVGVVGAGRIVERAHLPALTMRPDVAVTAIYDPDGQRSRALAQQFAIPTVCASLEELLACPVDLVLVACPNALHAPVTIAALEAGRHVLCEKPMAIDAAAAAAMAATARRTGKQVMIGFNNRFRPDISTLYALVRSGRIGRVQAIYGGWLRRNGVPGAQTWFTRRSLSGGGALIDLGSHLVDIALWLVDAAPVDVACTLGFSAPGPGSARWYTPLESATAYSGCDVETSAHARARLAGPIELEIEVSWACDTPADRTVIEVVGDAGRARIETLFGFSTEGARPLHPLTIWHGDQPIQHAVRSEPDLLAPYTQQLAFLLDSLRRGACLHERLEAHVAAVGLIDSFYAAAPPACYSAAATWPRYERNSLPWPVHPNC